ncbi:MAG: XTP/dITP diphosphatase [Ignavibacteria bacterium]|nr:XTP/dITP diphosphatase [Ignavibacteria bacterium]
MLKKIFIASKNKGKVQEISFALKKLNYEIFSLIDTPNIDDIPETGNSFEENAYLKAKSVFDIVKIPVISDDSGLEVDFLNGEPGIYSARYSGAESDDTKNIKLLLKKLGNTLINKRTARFKCVMVLYDGINKRVFDGECEGVILFSPKGENGFGYDPVFQPIGYDQSFAQMKIEEKEKISHRGKALKSLFKYLELESNM